MAIFLVISFALFTNQSFADSTENWRQKIEKASNKNERITFGIAEISNSESDAIHAARAIASAEMAKSFKLKITTESFQNLSYQQTREKSDSSKLNFSSSIHEATDEIDLIGLNLSNFEINHEKKIVQVAAILNLIEFEKYLTTKVQNNLLIVSNLPNSKRCTTIEDIKNLRKKVNFLNEADKYEELLLTFSDKQPRAIILKNEQNELVKKCRGLITISTSGISQNVVALVNKLLNSSGFSIDGLKNRKPASLGNVKILVNKELSPPENKFNRINILGKVIITLQIKNKENVLWTSKTIRQADNDLASTKMKLDIRLDDEIAKGITSLLEDNL